MVVYKFLSRTVAIRTEDPHYYQAMNTIMFYYYCYYYCYYYYYYVESHYLRYLNPCTEVPSCHILPFQPLMRNRYFPSEHLKAAPKRPESISEGGRIWQAWSLADGAQI